MYQLLYKQINFNKELKKIFIQNVNFFLNEKI